VKNWQLSNTLLNIIGFTFSFRICCQFGFEQLLHQCPGISKGVFSPRNYSSVFFQHELDRNLHNFPLNKKLFEDCKIILKSTLESLCDPNTYTILYSELSNNYIQCPAVPPYVLYKNMK
jgi:hypothetical protein